MAIELSDPDGFRRAFAEHERGVYAAAMRILGNGAQAQDVVQDVFLRLWRRPWAFDPTRGALGAYLRLMARSRALDVWREAQAAGRASDRLKIAVAGAETVRADDEPGRAVEREHTSELVVEALRHLPAAQREAIVLAYWGGLSADEIARRSAIPLGTAKSRIRLGLDRLREECGETLAAA